MDIRNGNILTQEQVAAFRAARPNEVMFIRPMAKEPTPVQQRRSPPRVGRNDPCPCGSGRKFKKCCLYRGPLREV